MFFIQTKFFATEIVLNSASVFTGKYKKVPAGTVAAIIGTLLYVLSPVDLLPDFLPGGFVDDAGIIGLCLTFTKYDVEQYKKFKENNDEEN